MNTINSLRTTGFRPRLELKTACMRSRSAVDLKAKFGANFGIETNKKAGNQLYFLPDS
jgi:hypothetical protein